MGPCPKERMERVRISFKIMLFCLIPVVIVTVAALLIINLQLRAATMTVLQDNRKISSCKSLNIRNVIKDITAEENTIC